MRLATLLMVGLFSFATTVHADDDDDSPTPAEIKMLFSVRIIARQSPILPLPPGMPLVSWKPKAATSVLPHSSLRIWR